VLTSGKSYIKKKKYLKLGFVTSGSFLYIQFYKLYALGIIYLRKKIIKVLNPRPICQIIAFAILFWKGTDFILCLKGYQQQ